MASLEQRGRKFRVVFCYQGKKYARTLGAPSEVSAKAALARLEENLYRLRLGTLAPPDDGDLVSFLLGELGKEKRTRAKLSDPTPDASPLTICGLFERFWSKLPPGSLEESTVRGMEIHERQLVRHFKNDFLIQSLKLSDLQGYVEVRSKDKGLHNESVSATTIKKAIVTLRTVWNWGRQHELLEKAFPSKGLKYPKGKAKPPFMTVGEITRRVKGESEAEAARLWECAFLTSSEVSELLSYVERQPLQPAVYAMFVFAAHTGARRAEIIRSTPADLDFTHGLVTIHERKRSHEKRTTRRVPMTPLLKNVLKDLLRKHPGVQATFWHELPAMRGQQKISPQPLDPDTAHYLFKHSLRGSKWEQLRGWHAFRHSFCSNAAASGIDQRVINAWVGHQTEEMVERYRHLIPNQQHAAINQVFANGNNGACEE